MSGKVDFLEDLALRLSRFPGLGFLSTYTTMLRQRKSNFDQTVGDYIGLSDNARQIGRDVGQAGRGAGGAGGDRKTKKRRPNSETL